MFWFKGLPLPEGCEDMGVVGIVYFPNTGKIKCIFEDEIPEDIKRKSNEAENNTIIEID